MKRVNNSLLRLIFNMLITKSEYGYPAESLDIIEQYGFAQIKMSNCST